MICEGNFSTSRTATSRGSSGEEIADGRREGLDVHEEGVVALQRRQRHEFRGRAGDFEGDLLRCLMEVRGPFWSRYPRLYERYRAVVRRAAVLRREKPADESMAFWTAIHTIPTTTEST